MLLDGKRVCEVAALLKVSTSAVSRWKQTVLSKGLDGLASKPHPGKPPRLSVTQKEELRGLLLAGGLAAGFATDCWTCARVAELIESHFGVKYHKDHVWKILRALGFTCQKPEHRARERDEERIATWRRRDWPRIKKRRVASEL